MAMLLRARHDLWFGIGRVGVAMLAGVAILGGLWGCSGVGESLGLGKQSPDEFAVVRNAPLTLPPNYTLRPPQPGAPRPQEAAISDQAAESVFGDEDKIRGTKVSQSESIGEVALLQRADALDTDPEIRRQIDQDFSIYVREEESFFNDLLFWRADDPLGSVVDAESESQRLQENAALGKSPTEGETPTIERREKALLEGIF